MLPGSTSRSGVVGGVPLTARLPGSDQTPQPQHKADPDDSHHDGGDDRADLAEEPGGDDDEKEKGERSGADPRTSSVIGDDGSVMGALARLLVGVAVAKTGERRKFTDQDLDHTLRKPTAAGAPAPLRSRSPNVMFTAVSAIDCDRPTYPTAAVKGSGHERKVTRSS